MFYMLIGLGEDATPIDFEITSSKVTFVKECSYFAWWLRGLGEKMIPDAFKLTRSKVKVIWVTFVTNYVNSCYTEHH